MTSLDQAKQVTASSNLAVPERRAPDWAARGCKMSKVPGGNLLLECPRGISGKALQSDCHLLLCKGICFLTQLRTASKTSPDGGDLGSLSASMSLVRKQKILSFCTGVAVAGAAYVSTQVVTLQSILRAAPLDGDCAEQ